VLGRGREEWTGWKRKKLGWMELGGVGGYEEKDGGVKYDCRWRMIAGVYNSVL